MTKRERPHDPNRLIKFEIAIKEKYGEEAIQNPKASWNQEKEQDYLRQRRKIYSERNEKSRDDMVEVDGVLIPKKLVTRKSDRTCPSCNKYSFEARDDLFMSKFDVCEICYIKFVEGREEQWRKKQLTNDKKSNELSEKN